MTSDLKATIHLSTPMMTPEVKGGKPLSTSNHSKSSSTVYQMPASANIVIQALVMTNRRPFLCVCLGDKACGSV